MEECRSGHVSLTFSTLLATHLPSLVVTTHSCALDHSIRPAIIAVTLTMRAVGSDGLFLFFLIRPT